MRSRRDHELVNCAAWQRAFKDFKQLKKGSSLCNENELDKPNLSFIYLKFDKLFVETATVKKGLPLVLSRKK